jgi:ABC-type transporter Mla MlaB component
MLQAPHTPTLLVDGSAVQEVDATGLQLLLALRRSAQERHQALELIHPTPTLRAALSLAGMLRVLVPEHML